MAGERLGTIWRDPLTEQPAMIIGRHKHRDAFDGKYYPAADFLVLDGSQPAAFIDCMDNWEPLGRFKLHRRTRFPNGVNYFWLWVRPDGSYLELLQSIRHDDPLADATPTEKQIAAWRKYVDGMVRKRLGVAEATP